jgi:hypothetical protein
VLRYVDDRAVGIAHEEAAEPPVLIGQRVDDLGSGVDLDVPPSSSPMTSP